MPAKRKSYTLEFRREAIQFWKGSGKRLCHVL
jgi:hypothetical protein